ncbi:MAG: cytochrome c oxidase subunit II [Candidatus Eisenbacteria bacterium]|nr:cytochrome c oxidase subunit II [Candidatus Eisenbacteria bacterium]
MYKRQPPALRRRAARWAAASMPFFPVSASTTSGKVDSLYLFLVLLTFFFSGLIATLIVVFTVRYRRRGRDEVPPQIEGSLRLEIVWTAIPLAIVLFTFVWAAGLYIQIREPPEKGIDVHVVAKQWMWKIQYPDGQQEINALHVPVGQPVRLTMISQDVIHSFFVPAFRLKQDVRPGTYVTTWFEATKPGTYDLFCAEYCGTDHSQMIGTVTVLPLADYETWLRERPTKSPSARGEQLFQQLGCNSCHRDDSLLRGPVLAGIYGRTVELNDGRRLRADENYIRESILDPAAKVVSGFQPIMPTFQGQLTEEEIGDLILFIRSLRPSGPMAPTVPQSREVPGTLPGGVPTASPAQPREIEPR